jgi:hypothetical protein
VFDVVVILVVVVVVGDGAVIVFAVVVVVFSTKMYANYVTQENKKHRIEPWQRFETATFCAAATK